MSIIRDILPDIIPDEKIVVEDESHLFRTTEYPDGTTKQQQKYLLNKAPVISIKNVYGTVDDNSEDFIEGQDYELSNDKTTIDFSVGGKSPDSDTEFYVTYTSRSIIDRYVEAHEEIISDVDDKKAEAISANFINQADGQELDELGKLFGELGKRRNRNDTEYRSYLKSIVQSFSGRGTVDGIKFAVSSGLGVNTGDINLFEDFENNEYEIGIVDFQKIEGGIDSSTVTTLAQLSDPSGVSFVATRYTLDGDSVVVEPGTSASSELHTGLGDGDTIGDGALGTRDDDPFTIHQLSGQTLIAGTTGVETLEEYGLGAANVGVFTVDGNEKGQENSTTLGGDSTTVGSSGSTSTAFTANKLGEGALGTDDTGLLIGYTTTDGDSITPTGPGASAQLLYIGRIGSLDIGEGTIGSADTDIEDSRTASGDTVTADASGITTSTQTLGLGDNELGEGSLGTQDTAIRTIHNLVGDTVILNSTGASLLEQYGIGAANVGVFTLSGNEQGQENQQTTSGDTVSATSSGTSDTTVTFGVGSDTIGAGEI